MPLVSVVMPLWNGEPFVAEAIDSVLQQTYPHFELIIVDDGSEDRSRAILDQYATRDPRVRPIHHEVHRGLVPALNTGCYAACGTFIARLDADDIALPERLEQQVGYLQEHPRVAVLGTAVHCITLTGDLSSLAACPPSGNLKEPLLQSNCLCHSTIMMRTAVFTRLGGYRPSCVFSEDYDLWMRCCDELEVVSLPTVLVLYRIHPRQASLTCVEQQVFGALAVRASTAIRRRTGHDPLTSRDPVDRATLHGLGIPDADIDAHLVKAYMNRPSILPLLGLTGAALEALRDVLSHRAPFADVTLGAS